MLLYHGTASTYLPSIQKGGLRPQPNKNFKVLDIDSLEGNPPTQYAVYLSTSRKTAEEFARLKASYVSAAPGELVAEYPNDIFRRQLEYYKSPHAPKPIKGAKPVVLEVEVSDDIRNKLHTDEDAPALGAFWYPGSIPASAIVKVDAL